MVEQILNKIKEFNIIMIHGHQRPDGDCLGSQFGLKEIIKYNFPEKEVYAVGENIDYLAFMGKTDEVSDDLYENALAICVDCGNSARLSDQRFKLAKFIIKIDHHIPVEDYGHINYVSEEKPACTQIIYELAKTWDLKLNYNAAKALYTGLVTDTGRFRYDGITKDTFMCAAELIDLGVSPKELDNQLSIETLETLKFKGYVLSNFQMTDEGLAYIVITKEIVEEYNVNFEDAANQVNLLSTIVTCPVWTLIIEYPTDTRLRIRSRSIPIDRLANLFDGGGHAFAAGGKLHSIEEWPKFVEAANKYILENKGE